MAKAGTRPDGASRGGDADLLVVGGGIGGLAAALALGRRGWRVRVLERASGFAEIGAGLQLGPNATRVLDAFGLLDRVIALGRLPRGLVLMNAMSGEQLTSLDLHGEFRARYGAPYVVMHRHDLLGVLLDACTCEDTIALEVDRDVCHVDSDDDRVRVRCTDGAEYEAAALIGADGLWSTVRGVVHRDEPVCSGYVAYRGARPLEEITHHADLRDVVAWIGPGLHFVQYSVRGDDLYNQVAVFRSPAYMRGAPDWGTPDELDQAFAATCPAVRDAIPAMLRDRRWPMYDRDPITTWTKDRVTLLGDAAHPMLQYLAQGACQAIEDAAALADALGDHVTGCDSLPKALRVYEETRSPRTALVQRRARQWGDMWHLDGIAARVRDELFRRLPQPDWEHLDWLYARTTHPLARTERALTP